MLPNLFFCSLCITFILLMHINIQQQLVFISRLHQKCTRAQLSKIYSYNEKENTILQFQLTFKELSFKKMSTQARFGTSSVPSIILFNLFFVSSSSSQLISSMTLPVESMSLARFSAEYCRRHGRLLLSNRDVGRISVPISKLSKEDFPAEISPINDITMI